MNSLLTSGAWQFCALRTLLLATLGWLPVENAVHAQLADAFAWPRTDFEKRRVDLDEIKSGGPRKDGIPPVDTPRFVGATEAGEWLDPREPVIVVQAGGETRAYPIQIMTWHEIVNDEVGGVPVSVTFCPLCNASIVFDRRLGGQVLDFGTTGKLRKSDLIMYDRQTESWWQQLTGEAIVGTLTGQVLDRLPSSTVAFGDFRRAFPDAPVLSRETGHRRAYGRNPYRGYDTIDGRPFLFFDPLDERLPPMERVLNVTEGDVHVLYPFTRLQAQPVVNDEVAGRPVVVMSKAGTLSALDGGVITESRLVPSATAYDRRIDGRTLTFRLAQGRVEDVETGSTWDLFGRAVGGPLAGRRLADVNAGVHFAFAWLAFRPDSRIYDGP